MRYPTLLVLSVPHTGTTFAAGFLQYIGIQTHRDWRDGYARVHSRYNDMKHPQWSKYGDELYDAPAIIPRRDPYLSLRSHLTRNTGTAKDVAESYRILYEELIPKVPEYFILDLHCPEEKRVEHLMDLARFVKADVDKHRETIVHFASEWKPINASTKDYVNVPSKDLKILEDARKWFEQTAIKS